MKIARSLVAVLPPVIGVLIAVGAPAGVRAAQPYAYLIAANDGYGIQDCLNGGECGQVVADAWCEAHGHGVALSFGPQSRLAGDLTQVSTAGEPYFINCGD